jgi:hypothetical protein
MLHHYRRLSLDGRPTSPSVAALVGMVVSSAYTSALPYYRTVGGGQLCSLAVPEGTSEAYSASVYSGARKGHHRTRRGGDL